MIRPLGLLCALLAWLAIAGPAAAQDAPPRERVRIDRDWRFAIGHATDQKRDFDHGAAAFFFAKAGYGDGPASAKFDDRAWRKLDLPHDWAVEMPFDARANTNHGSRAVGMAFPQNSVGWYRKVVAIPKSDEGRRISLELDGVYRNATLWVNGHYIGTEPSGYTSAAYDLTDYLRYGGDNVIVLRVDARVEEGWFYEGAGIYRHVWLTKTAPLHVGRWGTFVSSEVEGGTARITARSTIVNESATRRSFVVEDRVLDEAGRVLATARREAALDAGASGAGATLLTVADPRLWSVDAPVMHRLATTVLEGDRVVDRYETPFGIRTVRFDPDTGFWLNGRNIKLKGTNNHQDHAGVGVALPDALQVYRLKQLKAMGGNAYRASHNPPTPEMLDAADRLGVLVIDEHRMMGTSPEIKGQLTRLIERDRNHPSVILWSVGNEEWAIEGNEMGARLTKLMQDHVRTLDPTRRTTVAISGGAQAGSSTTTDTLGFNYRSQHDVDAYHRAYPNVPAMMSEEGSTVATRGVYITDREAVHIAAYDAPQRPTRTSSIEQGWTAVAERPWMAGMFVWTGFDYRGETTPFGWPAISSQFGMLDTTGRFKDSAWYLKSWWSAEPVVHLLPHWNWAGRKDPVPVWVYSNADEVELTLNGRSLGRKPMPRNGHLEWQVPFQPGALVATGYAGGRAIGSDRAETTNDPAALRLTPDRASIAADGDDVAMVAVSALDRRGRAVPTAANDVTFSIEGPGRIIGVGNGDPGSHEADRFVDGYQIAATEGWRVADLDLAAAHAGLPQVADDAWRDPFRWTPPGQEIPPPPAFLLGGRFTSPTGGEGAVTTLFLPDLPNDSRIFIDGADRTKALRRVDGRHQLPLTIPAGEHRIAVVVPTKGPEALKRVQDVGASNLAWVQVRTPAADWRRRLFTGHAQVIVQSTGGPGAIVLKARSPGLRDASFTIRAAR